MTKLLWLNYYEINFNGWKFEGQVWQMKFTLIIEKKLLWLLKKIMKLGSDKVRNEANKLARPQILCTNPEFGCPCVFHNCWR